MTPDEFREKWRAARLKESAGAKEHFLDLCAMLEIDPPAKVDPKGTWFTFEKAVTKAGGGKGFADVWKKGCFAWEYKGPDKSLVKAHAQLKEYADALENPPLLIVSDMDEIRIHTNFQNCVAKRYDIKLAEIGSPEAQRALRWAFESPESLRPTDTREMVTAEAAQRFAAIAQALRSRKLEPRKVAHFLNRLVFCMFVEDIGLLRDNVFAEIVERGMTERDLFPAMLADLFGAMRSDKGHFGTTPIPWFNGGLFDDDEVLHLGHAEMVALADSVKLDWSAIEPSIFGTLFERGLDPEKRKEMAGLFDGRDPPATLADTRRFFDRPAADRGVGIHYTDPATIMKLIEPVILRPLDAEWAETKAKLGPKAKDRDKAYLAFRERLGRVKVLDPACGSGNFLYLALTKLKDFDERVRHEAQAMGLPDDRERIGPENVCGIEINPYAAELARVTIWIGELQWQMRRGHKITRKPILTTLDTIECRDALLAPEGEWEASWPDAEFIIGNPPFLGDRRIVPVLGEEYARRLRNTFKDRVPGGADLVCYWFEKARAKLVGGNVGVFGFVATNSIRGGLNRVVLTRIIESNACIFDAWDDEPWSIDGAAVRVSIVCCSLAKWGFATYLNGKLVRSVHPDLSADGSDLTSARRLSENAETAYQGTISYGPFEIEGEIARNLLVEPANPDGSRNADVVRPWVNGQDITRRSSDHWIIFFPDSSTREKAALYEKPYRIVESIVRPFRAKRSNVELNRHWWRLWRSRPEYFQKAANLSRVIISPRVSKYRLFVWRSSSVVPDSATVAIVRDDDTTFGIVHSRFHELWSLRMGTWLGVGNDPRYTPSTTFETFPFPEGLTPNIPAEDYANDPRAKRIAAAAARLNELREAWLNPPDLVRREPEVVAGFPDRLVPRGEKAEAELKKRTLTNLYNARPQWLIDAHKALDDAVAAAYGWPSDLTDDEILARLLALNLERAAKQGAVAAAAAADDDADEDDAEAAAAPKKAKPTRKKAAAPAKGKGKGRK